MAIVSAQALSRIIASVPPDSRIAALNRFPLIFQPLYLCRLCGVPSGVPALLPDHPGE
jgi:hypothetical protein